MESKKRIIIILITFFCLLLSGNAYAQTEPASVLAKTVSNLKSYMGKGYDVSATLKQNDQTYPLKFKASGKKFYLNMASYSTWYDGKTLYNLNPQTKETTVSVPTAEDLKEINPFYLIANIQSRVSAKLTKKQPQSGYCIALDPKSKEDFKRIVLTVDKRFDIKRIDIYSASGERIVLNVTGQKVGALSPSVFAYPKEFSKKYNTVDLR